eukprot:FR738669.1.p2 GENE.FR738669.1~~FR738669.1.p2  ORF type:complete len:153 (-),score=4.92 FR738669.1:20-478(-)
MQVRNNGGECPRWEILQAAVRPPCFSLLAEDEQPFLRPSQAYRPKLKPTKAQAIRPAWTSSTHFEADIRRAVKAQLSKREFYELPRVLAQQLGARPTSSLRVSKYQRSYSRLLLNPNAVAREWRIGFRCRPVTHVSNADADTPISNKRWAIS